MVVALVLQAWGAAVAGAEGRRVTAPGTIHRPQVDVKSRRGTIWPVGIVSGDPAPIVTPIVVAPLTVVAPPPPLVVEAAPSGSLTGVVPSRPIVPNPGPKIIVVAPPAAGGTMVEVVVQRGLTATLEKVPLQ